MRWVVVAAVAALALVVEASAHAKRAKRKRSPGPPPTPYVRVDGAYGMRSLFNLPISGADLGFAAGARPARSNVLIWGAARGFLGRTESGLSVSSFRLGIEVEGIPLDRLRLGAGLSPSLVSVKRETRDSSIVGIGIEGRVILRVDLVQGDDVTFFLRAAGEATPMIRGDGVLWGAGFGLGLDFDVGPSRGPASQR